MSLHERTRPGRLQCAYVAGMADALVHDGTVCLPQVSTRQLVEVVMAYLRAHPESRIYSAASTGDVAFTQAFPCVSKRRPPGWGWEGGWGVAGMRETLILAVGCFLLLIMALALIVHFVVP